VVVRAADQPLRLALHHGVIPLLSNLTSAPAQAKPTAAAEVLIVQWRSRRFINSQSYIIQIRKCCCSGMQQLDSCSLLGRFITAFYASG